MIQPKQKLVDTDDEVLQAVSHALMLVQQQTGYDSIEITMHDGRVTQIERIEKVCFEHKAKINNCYITAEAKHFYIKT